MLGRLRKSGRDVRSALIVGWLLLSLPTSAMADEDPGWSAVHRSDYPAAMAYWEARASKGDAEAQYGVGFLYEQGLGVKQDFATALKWYAKSAEQDKAYAQEALGALYAKGQGVAQNWRT